MFIYIYLQYINPNANIYIYTYVSLHTYKNIYYSDTRTHKYACLIHMDKHIRTHKYPCLKHTSKHTIADYYLWSKCNLTRRTVARSIESFMHWSFCLFSSCEEWLGIFLVLACTFFPWLRSCKDKSLSSLLAAPAAWAHIDLTVRVATSLCCDTLTWSSYLFSANDALDAAMAAALQNTVSNDASFSLHWIYCHRNWKTADGIVLLAP